MRCLWMLKRPCGRILASNSQTNTGALSALAKHFFSSKTSTKQVAKETSEPNLPEVNYVNFSCDGINYKTAYVDVGQRQGPIFLGCHGIPGSLHNFQELYTPLTEAGVRMVVPEFPGNELTVGDGGMHITTRERHRFLLAFLSAVNIHRVDAVAGHSLGSFVAISLAANTDLPRSLVYLSGLGLKPHKAARPYWMLQTGSMVLKTKLGKVVLDNFMKMAYRARGFDIENEVGLDNGIHSVAGLEFDWINTCVVKIAEKKLPGIFLATQKDKMVEWPLQLDIARACGVEDVTYYDEEENIVSSTGSGSYPRAVFFARGGHTVFKSHTSISAQCIIDLLQYINR